MGLTVITIFIKSVVYKVILGIQCVDAHTYWNVMLTDLCKQDDKRMSCKNMRCSKISIHIISE